MLGAGPPNVAPDLGSCGPGSNWALVGQLQNRVAQQALVAQLGVEALRDQDAGDVFTRICHTVLVALDVDAAALWERQPDGVLALRNETGLGVPAGTIRTPGADGPSLPERVLSRGVPELVADWTKQAGKLATPPVAGVRSSVAVPIPGPDMPFGVLAGYSRESHAFSSDDVHFLQALANIASAAAERARAELRFRHAALHDTLTGLPNRLALSDRLEQALSRQRRNQDGLAVLFLDLDHFKNINDTLGHGAGDEFLHAIAARLVTAVRPSDTVARFGGDEFVLLCESVGTAEHAADLAERVMNEVRAPVLLEGHDSAETVHPGASIGIALAKSPGSTAESLLRDADTALYRAKDTGRGRVVVFRPELATQMAEHRRLEAALRRALEKHELRVFYQPTIDLDNRRIVGAEALVRWDHPERGLLSPGDFLPVAQDTGLIAPIGAVVLRDALREAESWPESLYLSVNVDPQQLGDAAGLHTLQAILDTGECPAERLVLEITEAALLDTGPETLRALRGLRAAGVRIAIDDFGTGYSSLSYLARLPVDILKIDRSFIEGLRHSTSSTEALAISKLIINLGHTLGLHVLAEGAETAEQLTLLTELGCDSAQGFHIGHPEPAGDFRARLRSER